MDIATSQAIQGLVSEIQSLKKQLRQKPNTETGGNWLSFGPYKDLGPFSVTGKEPYLQTVPRDLEMRQFRISVDVLPTNNGSHYWSIIFRTLSGIVVTLNTSGISSGTWTTLVANVADMAFTSVTTSHVYFYVSLSKTGTPGDLYLASPVLYFV